MNMSISLKATSPVLASFADYLHSNVEGLDYNHAIAIAVATVAGLTANRVRIEKKDGLATYMSLVDIPEDVFNNAIDIIFDNVTILVPNDAPMLVKKLSYSYTPLIKYIYRNGHFGWLGADVKDLFMKKKDMGGRTEAFSTAFTRCNTIPKQLAIDNLKITSNGRSISVLGSISSKDLLLLVKSNHESLLARFTNVHKGSTYDNHESVDKSFPTDVASMVKSLCNLKRFGELDITDPSNLSHQICECIDDLLRRKNTNAIDTQYAHAHLKVVRLAGILAVCEMQNDKPEITEGMLKWAKSFIENSIDSTIALITK